MDDGSDLESSAHLLGQVYGHLGRLARRDEVFQERGGEVFGEDSPVTKAPQVELQGFGFDQGSIGAVGELQLVEVGLARDRAQRRQLVGSELGRRAGFPVLPRHRVEPISPDWTPHVAAQYSIFFLLHKLSSPSETSGNEAMLPQEDSADVYRS